MLILKTKLKIVNLIVKGVDAPLTIQNKEGINMSGKNNKISDKDFNGCTLVLQLIGALTFAVITLIWHLGPEYPATCKDSKKAMLEEFKLELNSKGINFKHLDLIKLKETNYEDSGIRSCKGILVYEDLEKNKYELLKEFKVTKNALTIMERKENNEG